MPSWLVSSSFKISALTVFSLFWLYESFVSRLFVWGIMAKRAGELCCKCRKYQSFLDKILQIHNRKVERKSLRSLSSTLHLKNKFFFSRYCLYFWRKRFRSNIKCFCWHFETFALAEIMRTFALDTDVYFVFFLKYSKLLWIFMVN